MIENPFIISEKVIPRYFCDRKNESAQLIKLLCNGNNVVLVSPRRMGKTGLIQYCYQQPQIKNHFLTIYVDILSTSNLQEFTFMLGREVFETLRNRGDRWWKSFLTIVKSLSGKITFDSVTGLPSFNLQLGDVVNPEFTLKEIFQYLSKAEKPCIVAIDEFQQIKNYPETNVEALLRAHLLQINNCRMIFSGSEQHILADMFTNVARPFYQSASFIHLDAIPREIYSDFIVTLFHERDKGISREWAERIYDQFDGITFCIQRVCNGVFSNTPHRGEADIETLKFTLDEILHSFDTFFRMRMASLTTRQKETLLAIAAEGVVDQVTSAAFIRKHSLSSSSAVQTALKALIKEGYINRTDSSYRVEDRFFQLWLKGPSGYF